MTTFDSVKLSTVSALLPLGACTQKEEAVATAPLVAGAPWAATAPQPVTIVPGSARDFRVNAGDTAHFAYNEHAVPEDYNRSLSKQVAWLSRYPSIPIKIEGRCEERGMREYDLALGGRRANAVNEYLAALGVVCGGMVNSLVRFIERRGVVFW